jgi:uncharacterized protein
MQIDISRILKGETDRIDFEYQTEPTHEISDIQYTGALSITGKVQNMAGYMTLQMMVKIPYTTHCARCFREIQKIFTTNYEKPIAVIGSLEDQTNEEYLSVQKNGMLDPDPAITEIMLLDFPSIDLCKETCKGLCPKCGKDLNEGDCSCPKKEMDPRWAILGKLLDK